ncbi:MAG: YraN family protein [Natronospirillum sp.]
MSVVTGAAAEQHAAEHLEKAGLTVLARNVQCRWGEIDLILRDGNYWVFAEVKARRSQQFGGGLAAVTASKQRKLRRTAEWYLNYRKKPQQACRFDVIEVNLATQEITWIRNAF